MKYAITPMGHACVLVSNDRGSLIIDPGSFTADSALEASSNILITHEHFDHVNPALVSAHMDAHHDVHVWAPSDTVAALTQAGADAARIHEVAPGESFDAGGMSVSVLGGKHAVMFDDVPASQNVAFLIDGKILHPGDSFPDVAAETRVEVLMLPVAAPWLVVNDVVKYAKKINATVSFPIHDAILSETGQSVFDKIVGSKPGMPDYRRVPIGETLHAEF